MFQQLRIATLLLIAMTIVTGGIYPLVVTSVSQVAFRRQANGSIIYDEAKPIGSELIGQSFTKPEYFWGRLSATTLIPYNAASSSGSNLGPLNPALQAAAQARIEALIANGSPKSAIPVDLVTASGSGLDPHISPAAAEFQVPRVAAARKLPEDEVRKLVAAQSAGRQWGLLGEPCVNVLLLNRALDRHPREK